MTTLAKSTGKIITCILPKGKGLTVTQALHDKGVTRVNFAFARGFDIHDPAGKSGIPDEVEKEIVTVIAKDEAQGEEIFNLIWDVAEMNHLGGGLMTMAKLSHATAYELPDIPENTTSKARLVTEAAL